MWDKMKEIKGQCNVLSENIDAIEMMLVNKDNPIALDYIISRNPNILKKKINLPVEVQRRHDALTVKLKNAIMYHIVKTRVLKRIPNFTEILNMAIEK